MKEKIIDIVQKQVELFLLDANEFYPFGTYINQKDEIIPVGSYLEGDHLNSQELINLLEKGFKQGIQNGDYKIAVLAIDILIRKSNAMYDGIEMRFFEPNNEVYKKVYTYIIKDNSVEFVEYKE
jgi:hypothetical protein